MVPRTLYEALPTLYVLAGFITQLAIDGRLSVMSGSLFTLAGLLAFKMRMDNRTLQSDRLRSARARSYQ